MSDDRFDDGLVHGHHSWATVAPNPAVPQPVYPRAHVEHLRTPSTVHHDEHVLPG